MRIAREGYLHTDRRNSIMLNMQGHMPRYPSICPTGRKAIRAAFRTWLAETQDRLLSHSAGEESHLNNEWDEKWQSSEFE